MQNNLKSRDILDDWSPETELCLLGKPEKLNPHHVPGSRPAALVTVQQGWTDDQIGLNQINLTIKQGWFNKQTPSIHDQAESRK